MIAPQGKALVAYYRVSTKRQGKSGLGLEAQKEAVESYANERGCKIIAAYTEVESGTEISRPQLAAALLHARKYRATLIVGKLDRLGRKAWHLLKLLDERTVPIRFADFPDADETMLGFMIIVADREAKLIASRTKAALKAAKARGTKLGSHRPGHWTETNARKREAGLQKGIAKAATQNREKAQEFYAMVYPDIAELREQGESYHAIASTLNENGLAPRRGNKWHAAQVRHVVMNYTAVGGAAQ